MCQFPGKTRFPLGTLKAFFRNYKSFNHSHWHVMMFNPFLFTSKQLEQSHNWRSKHNRVANDYVYEEFAKCATLLCDFDLFEK
jgi:hypothetical protein